MRKVWAWPVPGWIPWSCPTSEECPFLPSGPSLAHVVEDGTILSVGKGRADTFDVVVEGATGKVLYSGIEDLKKPYDTVGHKVRRGEALGGVWGGFRIETLDDPTLMLPRLKEAWGQVTHRFHRDAPNIPRDPKEKQETIRWLMDHPLWHHDITYPDLDAIPESERGTESFLKNYINMDTSKLPRKTSRDGGSFYESICPEYVYVDPSMERIQTEDYEHHDDRDTAFRVWIESGGWSDQSLDPNNPVPDGGWKEWNQWMSCHDIRLDCGGNDMETALLQLAVRVKFFYTDEGEDRGTVEKRCTPRLRIDECEYGKCEDAGDGFCKVCGFLVRVRDDVEEE